VNNQAHNPLANLLHNLPVYHHLNQVLYQLVNHQVNQVLYQLVNHQVSQPAIHQVNQVVYQLVSLPRIRRLQQVNPRHSQQVNPRLSLLISQVDNLLVHPLDHQHLRLNSGVRLHGIVADIVNPVYVRINALDMELVR